MQPSTTRSITLLLFLSVLSLSSSSTSLSSACKSTPHPNLCRWMLSSSSSRSSSSPFKYSKFSLKQSLKHAHRLSKLISTIITSAHHVAEPQLSDCAHLFDLNVDYLHRITAELGSAESGQSSAELVGRVQALLSGVVTNQQTCYDGMIEISSTASSEGFASLLHAPVVNGSQIYSVALGLVSHALRRMRIKKRMKRVGHGSDSRRIL